MRKRDKSFAELWPVCEVLYCLGWAQEVGVLGIESVLRVFSNLAVNDLVGPAWRITAEALPCHTTALELGLPCPICVLASHILETAIA